MVYDDKAWCECGHEMEIVRPGKHQRVGCCDKVVLLQSQLSALQEAAREVVRLISKAVHSEDLELAADHLASLLPGEG